MATAKTTYISNPLEMIKPSATAVGLNIGTLFRLLLLQLFPVIIILIALVAGLVGHNNTVAFLLGAVAVIAITVIALLSLPAYNIILLASARGEKVALRPSLSQARPLVWPMLGLGILTVLAVLGGLILFIIPGLIFIAWYSLAAYVMIAEKLGIVASMKRSRELVRGRVWEIWGLSMLSAAAAAVPIIGSLLNLVLGIVLMPAMAIRYVQLSTTKPEDRPDVHWANYAVLVVAIFLGGMSADRSYQNLLDVKKNLNNSTYTY